MRLIRNFDVASYYPHQMVINGFCSRNIPNPKIYEETIQTRVKAKHSGDKATANALKLVLNTTYGCMLNGNNGKGFNDLYDPLMGRSVCISGQLQLIELTCHLVKDIPGLIPINLNTDGIMISFDEEYYPRVLEITQEWQERTGFTLEEDKIKKIVQKDVNNYVEIPFEGKPKIKGGVLVRGISTAGAFNINNNAPIVAQAVKECLANDIPVRQTIEASNNILDFQLICKVSHKFGDCYHEVDGQMVKVQKCNRVYATDDYRYGKLYKQNLTTGNLDKCAALPMNCLVDNDNHLKLEEVDKDWYVRLAQRYVNDFLGIENPKRNTRSVNKIKKGLLDIL